MTIQIEQTEMLSVDQLTGKNQLLLTMIPNAAAWVKQNIANKNNVLSFSTENELIEQVGIGLSGTSIIALPVSNLTLDIEKLIEISIEDILTFLSNERSSSISAVTSAEIVERYHLLTNDKLETVNQFFQSHKLTIPVGWNTGLYETLQCCQSLTYVDKMLKQKMSVKTEAIQWAFTQAQTLAEFGHYYCLYLYVHAHTNDNQITIVAINELISQLTDIVLNNLDCPQVTYELDQIHLQNAITQWNKSGSNLGFSSLTSGLLCIAMNINLTESNRISAEAAKYLDQLQQQLSEQLATDSYVNQAGVCRHYIYTLPQRTIMLNLSNEGSLTLYSDLPNA